MTEIREIKVADLKPDQNNANLGTERGGYALEKSLQDYGAGRSILIDRHGNVIAGNKTLEKSGEVGIEDVIVIQTDGKKIVAVQRMDLDLNDGPAARMLAYADNRAGELSLDWDMSQLASDMSMGFDLSDYWQDWELSEDGEGGYEGGSSDWLDGDGDDSAGGTRERLADVLFQLGPYRFTVPRDAYEEWLENIKIGVGFDKDSVLAEIQNRLEVTSADKIA